MVANFPCQVDVIAAHLSTAQPSGHYLQEHLSIYYQNVRGLRTKIDELFIAVSDAEYDVIVLTETWLNDQINSLQLFGSKYTAYRNDRDPDSTGKKRGGGVLIAVSNRLSSKQKNARTDLEQLWVDIRGRDTNICVGVVYIPPDSACDSDTIQKHIDSALDIATSIQPNTDHLLFDKKKKKPDGGLN
ncbi:uncharacterized protein LOC131687700 [Topomyia yanbarensis]|uniref:uncharacterized protein LOC131687700 n=1 Tax=Topomyia yanbarensis TaxID=2498891 RepID=UPI00273B4504|nr:uncharacterized protein LOC131687700 [Topomyia yanbarensis]